jgi:arylsulfatase A-like enzyme
VDSQIGRLLNALDSAGLSENTIIVLWGDHGWHLGEKGITGKNTLWDRSTHVPLIFAGPGVKQNARSTQPVELLDIYPTLIELCDLKSRDGLEGHSLKPQLKNPKAKREWPAITSHNQGNHGIRSERYRYIHYADGSEEFYDLQTDPNEWTDLVAKTELAGKIAEHRKWLPKIDLPPAPGSAQRVLTYDKATDKAVWEGKTVRRTDPIPE